MGLPALAPTLTLVSGIRPDTIATDLVESNFVRSGPPYTAFSGEDAIEVRLIVRRVAPTPSSPLELPPKGAFRE